MNNKRLFSIILVVFIDLLGFSLILPLLPYYAETFKASEFVTGLLVASYAAAQLIGAVVMVGVFAYVFVKNYNHPIVFRLKQEPAPARVSRGD